MLGFLLPKLAWLSLLAVAPIVIHLLNRIRLRRVDFSSLRFLSEVKRERFNWLRLKELLLLIARTALLLFLFLGLSRPFLKHGLFGIRREVSAVLIIDDSYSMQYGGNADQAKQAAKAYLAQLTGSSEAAVITATAANPLLLTTHYSLLTRDLKSLARGIDSIEMTFTGVDLAPAVELAQAQLEKAILPTREIVIFTDLQRRALASVPKLEGKPYALLVKDCGRTEERNCAVTEVSVKDRLPEPGKPASLSATLHNFGSADETRIATLNAAGVTESRTVSIPARDSKTIDFDRQFVEPGTHAGSVSLDADSLATDDQRFFALDIPSRLPVLIVGDTPEDTLYLSRALAPDTSGMFNVTTRLSPALRTVDLRRFKAVALVNPASLTAFDWQRVNDYTRQGGGLLLAVSRELKDKSFLSQYVGFQAEMKPTGFVTIEKSDSRHPVLEIFNGHADFTLPRFFHYSKLVPLNASVLASFSDGSPWLIESKTDRVIIAASGLSLADNDLPFRALFVPLVHRLTSYLAREKLRRDYLVSDTITTEAPGIGLVQVKTPDGDYTVTPEQQTELRTVRFIRTDRPGIYTIGEEQYAVNVLSDEGDLARMGDAELAKKNLVLLKDVRGRTSDLTNVFLIVAGLCLALEMMLLVL